MIERNNKTCIVCGKSYKYCSGCTEYAHLEPWHSIYCSGNCKEIFNIVSMYDKAPLEETKAKLDKCDLSNKNNFHKNILKVINEFYSVKDEVNEDIKTIKVEETMEVVKVIEEGNIAEVLDEIKEEDILLTVNVSEDIKETADKTSVTKTIPRNKKKKKDYEVI